MLKIIDANIVNFTNANIDQFFGMGEESNPLMMLIWILPVILFVFYGQRIQLYVTSNEIKKSIKKLETYRIESKDELLKHLKDSTGHLTYDPVDKISRLIDYFTIMPVDMDPAGIVSRVKHVIRTREDTTRQQVKMLLQRTQKEPGQMQIAQTQTLLEIASSLHMIHKTINHMFLTAKKQNNYPLILPLQMVLPFVMEQAESLRDAIPAFKDGHPIGDGIGPMVVGKMMLKLEKDDDIAPYTTVAKDMFEGRRLILLKAHGPESVVGRPADAIRNMVQAGRKIDVIIMIDAALKMEGEDSAVISQGFGAAIGGIGTERFEIERYASDMSIPVFSIVVKQSVCEAVTPMTKEIAQKADIARKQVYEMIKDNTSEKQTVLIIGVGNTMGVAQ